MTDTGEEAKDGLIDDMNQERTRRRKPRIPNTKRVRIKTASEDLPEITADE